MQLFGYKAYFSLAWFLSDTIRYCLCTFVNNICQFTKMRNRMNSIK